jgi:hypothetical protein
VEYESAIHERELKELRAKVGELVLGLDARKQWAASNGQDETRTGYLAHLIATRGLYAR